MQVGTLAIQHLFEHDVLYRVPLYQRPYVWTEQEQWQPLWEDLRRIAELSLEGQKPRAHFLGATVQDKVAVAPGQIETRLLIDGQQRLTTLQLFLKALHDVVQECGDQRYQGAIAKLIRNNHPLSTHQYETFKVWPTNADQKDYEAVMEAESRAELAKSYGARSDAKMVGRNIVDGYLYFSRAIELWLTDLAGGTPSEKIPALYGAVRDGVRLVVIDLDEKDDAQLIFETLNARGTPLLSADLVKNALLNEIEHSGGNTELAYQKYWQQFDYDSGFWRAQTGTGHARRARIEIFLQHALTILSRNDVSAAHLYAAYRDYAASPGAGSALDRLAGLKKYGLIYRELVNGFDQPRVRLFVYRLATMGFETVYPFLLKLFDKLAGDEERLLQVVTDLESFLVRRMVCRLNTRGYNRLFVDMLEALEGAPEQIPASVQEKLLSGTAEVDRWPTDAEFRTAWLMNPLYENLTRPRLRLLLEALESGLRNDFSESQAVPRNLTVEHIMPQSWEANWPIPAGQEAGLAAQERARAVHTLGNLTLLNSKLNPAQSNKAWSCPEDPEQGKREALKAHSVLFLNKAVAGYDVWDERAIEERGSILFEVARETWSRPDRPAEQPLSIIPEAPNDTLKVVSMPPA